MKKQEMKQKCLVGWDSDDALIGILIVVFIAIVVLAIVVMVVLYAGAFIGGFHALKNYVLSLKKNVYDENRQPVTA